MIGADMNATKQVLVTAGNRGMGYETCRELALKGHRVLLDCRDHCKREFTDW